MPLPNSILVNTCDILLRASTYDADTGQTVDTYSTSAAAVKCRLDTIKKGRYVNATADQEKVTHVMLINDSAAYTLLVKNNQVKVDGLAYRIISADPYYAHKSSIDHYEVFLERVA